MSDNVCQVDINKVLAGNGFGKSFPNVVDVVSSSEQSSVDKSADIATNADMDIEMDDSASREDENRSEEVGCAEDDSVKDYPKQIFTGNDILELYNICDFCHGPIFRVPKKGTEESRRYCCPKCQSAHSKSKSCGTKKKRNSTNGDSESKEDGTQNSIKGKTDDTGTEHEFNDGHDFNWTEYKEVIDSKGAPISCFKRVTKDVKGLEAGMKLEALDKNNPCNYCVATVIDVVGHRVQVCYDGFGDDEGQDFWCNFQAEELFPIGWCAGNGYPLQPPTGISSSLEDWKTFLTKTLTGALAAPVELFRESELRMQLRVHSFQAGMKIECVHPKRPDVICAATVTKSLGPYLYQVSTDVVQDTPPSQFYGHSETQGVFQTGWTSKQAMRTCKPVAKVLNDGPDGKPCIQLVRTSSGLMQPAKRPRCNRFKAGHKLEAVDLLNPSIIRVATVVATVGRLVLLYFDGANKFQFVDCESEEIYPSGWCLTTGHPLHASYGIDPSTLFSKKELTDEDSIRKDVSGDLPCTLTGLGYFEDSALSSDNSDSSHELHSVARDLASAETSFNHRLVTIGNFARRKLTPCISGTEMSEKPINVKWTLCGIDKVLSYPKTHYRWSQTARDEINESGHRTECPNVTVANEDVGAGTQGLSQRLLKALERLEETMEEGFTKLSRNLKILNNRVSILEEKFELNLLDLSVKKRRLHEGDYIQDRNRLGNIHGLRQYSDCGVQTEILSCRAVSGDSVPSTSANDGRGSRLESSPSSGYVYRDLSQGYITEAVVPTEQREHTLPQIMEVVGTANRERDFAKCSDDLPKTSIPTFQAADAALYSQSDTSDHVIKPCNSRLSDSSFSDFVTCTMVGRTVPGMTKTALLNQTLRAAGNEELFSGLSTEKLNAVKVIARQQSKRHEFALKLLDIFFTEEEQASLKEPGGGCLRNLDLHRLQKIKGFCFYYYPVKEDETEEGSWKFVIQKINSKCRCRRFSYKQKLQSAS